MVSSGFYNMQIVRLFKKIFGRPPEGQTYAEWKQWYEATQFYRDLESYFNKPLFQELAKEKKLPLGRGPFKFRIQGLDSE